MKKKTSLLSILASISMGVMVISVWEVSKGWAVILGVSFLFIRLWERMWESKNV